MIRVAISGFGRIGKTFLRTVMQDSSAQKKIDIVAINIGPADKILTAHLFKYDTLMGIFPGSVELQENVLTINGHAIRILNELEPEKLPWKQLNIDWVVDCSGKFTHRDGAMKHIASGAKYVLVSAPCTGDDVTIIPGVNDKAFDKTKNKMVSLGSCTTNAFMPMLKVLKESCGLQKGFMTTVHAYTNTQALIDVDIHDARRSRAAALNIVPTTSGATSTLKKIFPELVGKIDGCALRVPVAKVSIIDFSFQSDRILSVAMINDAFKKAAQNQLKQILDITVEPLVSSDFNGNSHSVIIDSLMTQAIENMGKAFGWYDNEWGYSERLKDFLLMVA